MKQKSIGYWTDETIINELEIVIKELDHFPTQAELIKIKRSDLSSSIIRYGSFSYYRNKMGYESLRKSKNYWNKEKITSELELLIEEIGKFPTFSDLRKMKRNDLCGAIKENGGFINFREDMGYEIIQKPIGYWNEKLIITELKIIIEKTSCFPTFTDLRKMKRDDLNGAIAKHGGLNYFRDLLKFKPLHKPSNYWNEKNIVIELEFIIKEIGYFPTQFKLSELKRSDLITAISRYGGMNKFRRLLGYKTLREYNNRWNEEFIITELKLIINKIDHFPTDTELRYLKRNDLSRAISKHGGFPYFRELLNYVIIKKPAGYWSEGTILTELKLIIKKIDHYPSETELKDLNIKGLIWAISQHGGVTHFYELLGLDITEIKRTKGKMSSYINKRGNNSEKIVKELITKWCEIHNLSQPDFNVKLAKGNIIEFVCDLDKRIGIDVTNTKAGIHNTRTTIINKWKKKEYHLHLDELWIVVFSDILTESDYVKFNKRSPENVKVMSIETFMEELNITIDNNLQLKIDNYNACTFHNKDELIIPKQGLGKYFKIKPDIRIKI